MQVKYYYILGTKNGNEKSFCSTRLVVDAWLVEMYGVSHLAKGDQFLVDFYYVI